MIVHLVSYVEGVIREVRHLDLIGRFAHHYLHIFLSINEYYDLL